MNVALWIAAGLLAAAFAAAGTVKLVTPRERLADRMSWTTDATDTQVKALGALELAGAIGLILPAAFDIAPVLVPIAAVGLALTMIGAIVVHVRHREGIPAAAPAIVLGLMCAFVAYGRFGPSPF
ncbi:MAG: DoxX family protein [Acidimicrobiales bacterium]